MGSVKTIEELEKIIEELKKQGKKIVTTNGSFDLLHIAHVRLLEKAKSFGDILIVLINSDLSVKKNKGKARPIIPENERAEMTAALACVDYVVIFSQDTPLEYLKRLKPHIHTKGGSWIEERIKEEESLLKQWRGRFVNFDLEKGYSTTRIINKILFAYKKNTYMRIQRLKNYIAILLAGFFIMIFSILITLLLL
jgi:rfaE bifunctional protein nucleotidyltransferase chain/domain